MMRRLRWGLVGLLGAALAFAILPNAGKAPSVTIHPKSAAANGSWPVYHRDNAHTGNDPTLPQVTGATAGWVSAVLDQEIYASALVYNGVVYAATLNNTVYALDQATGTTLWSKNLGAPQTGGWNCGNVSPQGILGTPVIDTVANRIYAVAQLAGTTAPTYHLFGLDLANFGNVVFDTTIAPTGFNWQTQQERGALALANGYVYIPFGGRFGDCTPYNAWVVAAPTSGGAPLVWQSPSVGEGIWAAGGIAVDNATGNIFAATGNARPCTGATLSDSVVRLSPTLTNMSFFQPVDWDANWCTPDLDLGSAGPILLSSSLVFMAGKHGGGFLLDPNNLGGTNGQLFPAKNPYVQADVCFGNTNDATFGSFAYAAPFVYLECEGRGIVALNTNTATPSFSLCDAACAAPNWHTAVTSTFGPPIVAGGAVFAATDGGGLYAFDAATGTQIYKSANFNINRFVTPAEAGGQVFVPSKTVVRSFNMQFICSGTPVSTSYFNWYDNATPGMVGDNIHVLNPGTTTSSGCVTLGSKSLGFNLAAGAETHLAFPPGTIGGPVLVQTMSGPSVLASQRVQYYQTFNEVWALSAAQAAMTSYINWFDKATPGMITDNIHILNPGSAPASVTVSLPGASPLSLSVAAGAEGYTSFPASTIGGPVTISSNVPVLSSARVQYYQSFNEVVGRSAAQAAAMSFFNWFDNATVGMFTDNIHVLNTSGSAANVQITMPGATTQSLTLAAGAQGYASFPPGSIGGPVTVSSNVAVLATQRVRYYQTFNEVASESTGQAQGTSHLMWFDKATVGMYTDNIHVLNTSASAANVQITMPGATALNLSVAAGAEGYASFSQGTIGGPVTINSNVPVIAAQRVQYYQSFNEVPAA